MLDFSALNHPTTLPLIGEAFIVPDFEGLKTWESQSTSAHLETLHRVDCVSGPALSADCCRDP